MRGRRKSPPSVDKKVRKGKAKAGNDSSDSDSDGEAVLGVLSRLKGLQQVMVGSSRRLGPVRLAQLALVGYVVYWLFDYTFIAGDRTVQLVCTWQKGNTYKCGNSDYCIGPRSSALGYCDTSVMQELTPQNTARRWLSGVGSVWSLIYNQWHVLLGIAGVLYFSWDGEYAGKLMSRVGKKRDSLSSRDLKKVLNTTARRISGPRSRPKPKPKPKPKRVVKRAETSEDEGNDSSGESSDGSTSGGSDSDDSSSDESGSD